MNTAALAGISIAFALNTVMVVLLVERFIGPVTAGAVLMSALAIGAVCWVVTDDRRAVRLSVLIQAVRGHQPFRINAAWTSEDAAPQPKPNPTPEQDTTESG